MTLRYQIGELYVADKEPFVASDGEMLYADIEPSLGVHYICPLFPVVFLNFTHSFQSWASSSNRFPVSAWPSLSHVGAILVFPPLLAILFTRSWHTNKDQQKWPDQTATLRQIVSSSQD